MRKVQLQLPIEFHGCKGGLVCNNNSACFTPHPWSFTGETCLFSSAYMRSKHAAYELARSVTREASYYEATEIQLKASLLDRKTKHK